MSVTIRRVTAQEFPQHASALTELLRDAVDAEASVGFLPPMSTAEGQEFWQSVSAGVAAGTTLLLIAEEAGQLVGTVQLVLATKPNGLHRAEVSKLLVPTWAQRRGIGRQLMRAAEETARQHGRSTLVLDTLQGAGSELLYQSLGYTAAGVIPAFARVPSGELEATVVYYKLLK
ncbi:GNAT family N-acetyltransferase [Hymenobacter endophyticus]|uniref:GNAT family N-acetyltransferase n=1 Tax=Hymenobacter endophyticus TaxID=3076335 RepID=A0ABU3TDQ6_9BACT|nr:GNAT family N-acetyltransferase [Hymenobacter endophyticus]MDU0369503.1 GNAT family N-acetyltransferase [Hymenobacter endophyticus]